MVGSPASRRCNERERTCDFDQLIGHGVYRMGSTLAVASLNGVTAHGIPIGPLQFDRLEAAPAARCTSRTQGNVSKNTEEVMMADQSSTLMRREEVAEGTMAFHFEKPSGFSFRAGQFADVTLIDPPETDAKGNTRTFSIASPPFAEELVFTTRMRNTAFKRSLKKVPLTAEVKIG